MQISCGSDASMLITEDRKLYTWGRNQRFQLGLGDSSYTGLSRKLIPTQVELPEGETPLRGCMGTDCAAVLCESENVFWWGMKSGFPRGFM